MKIKANVKAGKHDDCPPYICGVNHNQTVAHGLKVKTNVKVGIGACKPLECGSNHNQTVAKGLKVKTGIKAGPAAPPTIRD